MTYAEYRKRTRDFLSVIDEKTDFLGFKVNSDREIISGSLFDVCLDHAKAIVVTLENNLYASSYALVRPLAESFIRAAWILHCANASGISDAKKDKFNLPLKKMLYAVEKEKKWKSALSKVLKTSLNNMHSYTHGGIQIVARRVEGNYIQHIENEEELIEILRFVVIISFLTVNEMYGMSAGFNKENEFLSNLLDELCNWCFIPNQ